MQRRTTSVCMRRYAVALPNRHVLSALDRLGIGLLWLPFLVAASIGMVLALRLEYVLNIEVGYHASLIVGLSLAFVTGLILRLVPGRTYRQYYRHVYQGKVVHKELEGKGESRAWLLTVRGNTYANEMKTDTHFVDVSLWEQVNVGDIVQLPEPRPLSR